MSYFNVDTNISDFAKSGVVRFYIFFRNCSFKVFSVAQMLSLINLVKRRGWSDHCCCFKLSICFLFCSCLLLPQFLSIGFPLFFVCWYIVGSEITLTFLLGHLLMLFSMERFAMLMKILCLQLWLHNCRTSYLPNGKSTPTCGVDDAKISFQLKIQNLVKSYLQLLACVNLDDLGVHRYNSSNSAYTSHFFRRLQVSGSWNECHGSAARDQPCCGFSG